MESTVETMEQSAEDSAAEEAAFLESFTSPDVEAPEEVSEPETATEPAPPEPEEPAASQEPVEPQLTIDDLKAAFEAREAENQKKLDKIFGKIGDLQSKIDAARSSASGISPKARENLAKDFPELAEMLFDGAEAPPPYQPPPPRDDTNKIVEVERSLERRLLNRDHKDWEQVVQSQGFADWKATVLTPDEAFALDDSWDADFISAKLTEFKSWQSTQTKKATQSQQRLEAAVTPRGVPSAGTASSGDDSEEDWMMKSYKAR